MSDPMLIVVGAGPGVGVAVARRFAREGYAVGLVGRRSEVLDGLAAEVAEQGATVRSVAVDLTDVSAATAALAELAAGAGAVDVLHFNPSAFRQKDPLQLTVSELLDDVALGVGGLLTAVQAVQAYLKPGSRVTATGSIAADRPWHQAASLGVQKAGLRNLVTSLDATLAPAGIRAVSVTVRGTLAEEGAFAPDRVADAIWNAAHQDEASWRTEVPYSG